MSYTIIQGDNRETLKTIADNSIDAIVTDPPYGIDFLGKAWDANTGALETYQECLRVLKPGGHILAFSAARTYHHLAVTLEQAGFEIRDQIMWIYSSGFPKSQDIGKSIERTEKKRKTLPSDNSSQIVGMGTECPKCGKKENGSNQYKCQEDPCPLREVLKPADNEWAGWGTALKPAHEPIALARKPLHKNLSIAKNAQKWGTGALNIDATRIPYDGPTDKPVPHGGKARQHKDSPGWMADNTGYGIIENPEINPIGRFPSNVIGEIEEQYQKYFYCPKVSRKERHIGFDLDTIPTQPEGKFDRSNDPGNGNERILNKGGNNHPTVKPVALMEYLIKLITPPGGTVLDPFNGSGSTGMAAVGLGYDYIGCELDPAYVDIANKRIAAWLEKDQPEEPKISPVFEELFSAAE